MRCAAVSSSFLAVTGRWDAAYNLTVLDYMREHKLSETPENIRAAMAAIQANSVALATEARGLRQQAATLLAQARELDEKVKVGR